MATSTAGSKLDKRNLKRPDEFQSWGNRATHFVAENAFTVIGGTLLALLGIASIYGYLQQREARELEASGKLFAGEKKMEDPGMKLSQFKIPGMNEPNPLDVQAAIGEFEKVAAEYPGTRVARRANVLAGDAYVTIAKFDEAAKSYEAGVGGMPEERFYALNGLAHALETKPAYDEAAAAYRRIIADTTLPFRDLATIDLARTLESAGKVEEAKTVLSSFATDFKDSPARSRADAKLAKLGGTPVAVTPEATPAAPGVN